jgi:glucose 1-dehydrogenase
MFAAAVREFGTIDILVSNAGMERNAPFHEMTTAQWDACMNVNLRGAFLCAREAVREFLRRGVRPSFGRGRQDHLHELGPRSHSVGRPRELCRLERRADAVDEEPRAGSRRESASASTPSRRARSARRSTRRLVDAEAYARLMKLVPYKRIGEVEEIGRAAVWLARISPTTSSERRSSSTVGCTLYRVSRPEADIALAL